METLSGRHTLGSPVATLWGLAGGRYALWTVGCAALIQLCFWHAPACRWEEEQVGFRRHCRFYRRAVAR